MLTVSMCLHIFGPIANFKTVGIPFFFIYPLVSVLAPIFGVLGCMAGSVSFLKTQLTMNSSCVLINYPLTLALMIFIQDEPAYIAILIMLWLNKILISFFGAKVRQHLINPRFISNQTTFKEFADFMNSSVAKFPRSRTVV
jgi:hypothetical protein